MEVLGEFREHLHSYLRSRLVGEFAAEPGRTSAAEVLHHIEEIDQRLQAEQERCFSADLVRKCGDGRAVTGVGATLAAIGRGEAQLLIVEEGFELPGYLCRRCRSFSTKEAICPQCRRPAELCPDIVDEAVTMALQKNCIIQHVQTHTPLREAGRIGALLRY